MGRPYARELAALADTVQWAASVDVGAIQEFVAHTRGTPLLAVGSGGSMAAAHFAALLHRHYAAATSRHATPLEILFDEPHLERSAVLILSASGRNHDVLAAARSATDAEVLALGSISTRSKSPLAEEVGAYCRGFPFAEQSPAGKDGFLATNSLLATHVILARAYGVELSPIDASPAFPDPAIVGDRRTAIVLHAGWSSPTATDLESRLHESTLLNVQVSDYRNFGHGRHLWLSRRGEESLILALVTPETASIAKRTLRLIPEGIPVLRFETSTGGPSGCINLLTAVLHWTGALGELQSFDPGRPHVPTFGRRLYHVRPPNGGAAAVATPVQRKLRRIASDDDVARNLYDNALAAYERKLSQTEFGAVAVDYDGTLCSTRDRFNPLPAEMADACARLLRMGLLLGIATGRGKSVREALRKALPSKLWNRVLVGYYNGSDVAPLTSDDAPDKNRPLDEAIASLHRHLEADPLIKAFAQVEVRPSQITVSPRLEAPAADLHTYLLEILDRRSSPVRLVRSGHSIDLLAPGVSKMRVVKQMDREIKPRSILCIGDRGAWPGNDAELLSHDISLSVDHVSSSFSSCWNLAPPGLLGPRATLQYLSALTESDGAVRLSLDRFTGKPS